VASSPAAARPLDELGARTVRKVRNKIMPLVVLLYFIAYLDRNTVGFAKLDMSEDIGLSGAAALAITAVATLLYARATGAGRPPEDREDLVQRATLAPDDRPERHP